MKEIIKPYVRLSIYELACKISETYPEGFLVKIDNEEDFLMIQYLLRSDTLVGEGSEEMDYNYWLQTSENKNYWYFKCLSSNFNYVKNYADELKANTESLFNSYYGNLEGIKEVAALWPKLSVSEAISFLKSLHGVPMSKQQKQKLLDIINEI